MARGPKAVETPNDGMSWLALAPFPAFNPLNWWALTTPRNFWLASLNNTRLALDAWRAGADGVRAMMRLQQDEMLSALEAPLERRADGAEAVDGDGAAAATEAAKDAEADANAAASMLVQPMIEATRAYGRVGRAFIVAQRDTMRAFAQSSKPH
ncbi:MAG: hypothetical protein ACT4OF_06310 [Caulobacteraceae bacterium]